MNTNETELLELSGQWSAGLQTDNLDDIDQLNGVRDKLTTTPAGSVRGVKAKVAAAKAAADQDMTRSMQSLLASALEDLEDLEDLGRTQLLGAI